MTNAGVTVLGPGKFDLVSHPVPEVGPSEVLIRSAFVGICGTDHELVEGKVKHVSDSYPLVLGHEYSGVIAEVGSAISDFKVGDSVVGECISTCGVCRECDSGHRLHCADRREVGVLKHDGALASYVKLPAARVHRIPAGISLERAALTEPLAVVVHGLKIAGLWRSAPRSVAVLGAGSLGHLAVKVLAAQGFKEISVVDRSAARLELLTQVWKKVTRLEPGLLSTVDVVLEFTGDGQMLSEAVAALRSESTLLAVGLPYERARLDAERIVVQQLRVLGSLGADSEDFRDALQLLGGLSVEPYLRSVFPIADFRAAFAYSRTAESTLKTMIRVN